MPSLLDLSAELQLLIIGYLDTPSTTCDPPAAYYAPKTSQDVASLSSCCQTLRRLAAGMLYRNICLRNDDKSGNSLQAVAKSPWTANLVRELNFEAIIDLDDVREEEEPNPLPSQALPSSVAEVLSHLDRFPRLETLTVQFKCGETKEEDNDAVDSNVYEIWDTPDPYRDFAELKQQEEKSVWLALMAGTYDAISASKRHGALTTLELRNVLPSGVSSFTTEPWQAFLRTLKVFGLSMHGTTDQFNTVHGYQAFTENLDLLFFSQLASATKFRFAATEAGMPGVAGHIHAAFPLNVKDMPMLEVFELRHCFISERTARFIAGRAKTLKRIALEDCYSAATCELAQEHTTWATFLNIIADSLEAIDDPPLETFFVSPRILSIGREPDGDYPPGSVPIEGDERQIELALSISRTEPPRRPFDYAGLDMKYGFLSPDQEQNLDAFLAGHDQVAYDRVMAIVGRQ
jgi:hypothetical protein